MIDIALRAGKESSITRKHPWIFSGAIKYLEKHPLDGDIVRVTDHKNNFLAIGHYQQGASIAIRIISFQDKVIDQDFWNHKIMSAFIYRTKLGIMVPGYTNAYRLFHGEGDGIPGLIIDIYDSVAVIQCHSIGVHKSLQNISLALQNVFDSNLSTIYCRTEDTLPLPYGNDITNCFLLGDQAEVTIQENGVGFKINVITGQKTGFFLDQRENRKILGETSNGKTVLNCFCYTGGFSLYALKHGATQVDSVDISQKAMDLLEENLTLNKINDKHTSHCANVMQFLSDHTVPSFDIVIVDPPAFAKSLHKRHNAVQAYKRLNVSALKKVKNGGFLFTFSCSQVVGTQLFYDTIVAAGIESGRSIRVVSHLSQGPDHPTNIFHPEGHYLKGLILYIEA